MKPTTTYTKEPGTNLMVTTVRLNGKVIYRQLGPMSEKEVKERVEKHLHPKVYESYKPTKGFNNSPVLTRNRRKQ